MQFNDYQQQALKTVMATDDEFKDLAHFVLGTVGEAGEIAEKFKKIVRDKGGVVSDDDKVELGKEIGDVLWYLAVLAHQLDMTFDDIAQKNIAKLADRQQRNTIGGSGDNR